MIERFWEVTRGDGCFYLLEHSYLNPENDRHNRNETDQYWSASERTDFKLDVMVRKITLDKTVYYVRDIAYMNAKEFQSVVKNIHNKSYERVHLND